MNTMISRPLQETTRPGKDTSGSTSQSLTRAASILPEGSLNT